MLLCVDVGNTNIVLAIFEGPIVQHHWRIKTERTMTKDELGAKVYTLFSISAVDLGSVDAIIVASVVPSLVETIEAFSKEFFMKKPLVVTSALELGMPIHYHKPQDLGTDRIVNAVGAFEKHKTGLIVVDFGTATTFDYVSSGGAFMGGVIAPGLTLSSEALFAKGAQLPKIETFFKPDSVIAKDTVSSLNAGIIFGYSGLVEGIVARMREASGEALTVIATGGLAPLMRNMTHAIDHEEPLLTLEGLRIIYERNRS
jgi:type III pantothenate kinase